MSKILENLYKSLTLGVFLALIIVVWYHGDRVSHADYWGPFFTWLHVLSGITWIGLLYYFNLVQTPMMPKISADLKPAVSKFIAPEALFWFRWSALSTVITGLIVIALNQGHQGAMRAFMLQEPNRTIGTGMWLGLIMAFNVWFIIWPNQKKALGIVKVEDSAKAKAARVAMLASRANFVLSLPMLYCMVAFRLLG
jgi:uncharacterized membrane protein